MTRDEKKAMGVSLFGAIIVFVFVLCLFAGIYFIIQDMKQDIADQGGFKGIAISVGKTFKEIKQEIDKEEPNGENTD